jgi:DNA mismatch repair protein MSH5
VALIAFLAHVGSFVPAVSAKIGILKHIHTRIQTVESIATNISAFMIDLKQVNYAYSRIYTICFLSGIHNLI